MPISRRAKIPSRVGADLARGQDASLASGQMPSEEPSASASSGVGASTAAAIAIVRARNSSMMDSLFRGFNYFSGRRSSRQRRGRLKVAREVLSVVIVLSLFLFYQHSNQDDRRGCTWPVSCADGWRLVVDETSLSRLNGNLIEVWRQSVRPNWPFTVQTHATQSSGSLETEFAPKTKRRSLAKRKQLHAQVWAQRRVNLQTLERRRGKRSRESWQMVADHAAGASGELLLVVSQTADKEPANEVSKSEELAAEFELDTGEHAENHLAGGSANNNGLASGESATNVSACEQVDGMLIEVPSALVCVVFSLLYATIFAIGLIGNALTIYAMLWKRERASVIDMFIANLALSDIMLCIFAVPITPIYLLHYGNWVFGSSLCKLFAFAMSASVYISTFTMINIAYLRYRLIVYPHEKSITKSAAFQLNLCTWFLGFVVTYPYLAHVGLLPAENCSIKFCDERWDQEIYRFWFSVITLILQFCLPFSAVTFFYASVFRKLREQRHKRLGRQHQQDRNPNPNQSQNQSQEQRGANGAQRVQLLALREPHSVAEICTSASRAPADESMRRSSHLDLTRGAQTDEEKEALAMSNIMSSATMPQLSRQSGARDREEVCGEQVELSQRPASSVALVAARNVNASGECKLHLSRAASWLRVGGAAAVSHLSSASVAIGANAEDIIALRERRLREKNKRHSQTNRKLVFMVALFVGSWLPLNLFNLIQDYVDSVSESPYVKHFFLTVHVIACSSVCYNPILYAWMSDNYRQELQDILPRFLVSAYNYSVRLTGSRVLA